MKPTIQGKKPLSTKRQGGPLKEPDFFRNRMAISADLKAELEKQGLDWRFIDYKKYANDGGVHKRGWTVYKRKTPAADTPAFLHGSAPDGTVRVGSSVLAVRKMEWSEQHRAYLKERVNLYSGFKKQKADELRERAREAKVDGIVDDTFDDDGDEREGG